jgi:hypothetical protein
MPRLLVLLMLVCIVPSISASEPSPLEKQIAIQNAMATAEQHLQGGNPAQAVAVLEAELSKVDGNKAFLAILKRAYLSEMASLMNDPNANAKRLTQVRRNLEILVGGNPTTPPSNPTMAVPNAAPGAADLSPRPSPVIEKPIGESNIVAEAAKAFYKGDYEQAERLFTSIGAAKLNQNQKTAWAFCRIKIGAGKVNSLQCDAATAASVEKDVSEAIKLIPQHAELLKISQQVIAVAGLKANNRDGTVAQNASPLPDITTKPATTNSTDLVETASFRVQHTGARELAETVAKTAENARREIFERWSGPPAGSWDLKCEIVIHPTAEAYARATGRPSASTGAANVRLTNGRVSERRIDLRADDAAMVANALPRELTHIVLADLFPDKPPPKWAEEGMAVLAGTAEEASRYTSTLRRCARDGEWFGVAQLMDLKDYPAEKITGFYCESVSLTQYLVHAHGEKNFTIFLRDCQRYGTTQALKRQYGMDNPQALETVWKRSVLEVGRAQAP